MLILAAYIPTLTHRELRGFVKAAKALSALLKRHVVFKEFEVVNVAGAAIMMTALLPAIASALSAIMPAPAPWAPLRHWMRSIRLLA